MSAVENAPSWADSLSAYAAAAAFLVALAALWVSVRSAKHAKRSADASEQSALASDRSAAASERSALAAEQVAEIEAMRDMEPTIAWSLERPAKERLLLRNTGAETATGVTVAPLEHILNDPPLDATIRPHGFVEFGFTVGRMRAPGELTVTCNELAEAVLVEVPRWP